jgi:hypothetical protein
MYIQEGERRLILPWERDGKGMGTMHGSGRFEMHIGEVRQRTF